MVHQSDKFHRLLQCLSEKQSEKIALDLANLDSNRKFDQLCDILLRRFSPSTGQKLDHLLTISYDEGVKPSEFLLKLRSLVGKERSQESFAGDFLKSVFLSKMPNHVRSVLASKLDSPLHDLAKIADEICLHSKGDDSSSFQSNLHKSLVDSRIEKLTVKLDEMSRQLSSLQSSAKPRGSSPRDSRNSGSWRNSNWRNFASGYPRDFYGGNASPRGFNPSYYQNDRGYYLSYQSSSQSWRNSGHGRGNPGFSNRPRHNLN